MFGRGKEVVSWTCEDVVGSNGVVSHVETAKGSIVR
jgi:hypothetical protein